MDSSGNSPDQYQPIGPRSAYIIGVSDFDHRTVPRDALFYRPDQDFSGLGQEVEQDPTSVGLTGYQYWVETGWKTEHGTYDSVKRFSAKVVEEYQELCIAVADYGQQPTQAMHNELVSEAGDVLWCLTALASNGGADIDSSFKNLLYRYVRGILHYDDQVKPFAPSWRPVAAELATKWGGVTTGEVDELIGAGFELTPSPVMNIYDPAQFDEDPLDHLAALYGYLVGIQGRQEQQFGYDDTLVTKDTFTAHGHELGELVARAFLEVAFCTYHISGEAITLSEIVAHNVSKVSKRIQSQRVDKTDGQRGTDLL